MGKTRFAIVSRFDSSHFVGECYQHPRPLDAPTVRWTLTFIRHGKILILESDFIKMRVVKRVSLPKWKQPLVL